MANINNSKESEWSINSDIYDIVDSIKGVQKRYIEDEDETTLSLGVFGFVADTEAKKIQTATIIAGQLGNEMFPTRASLTKNVIAHATYNGIEDINAVPANITVTICIKIDDIDKYIDNDNCFYLDCNNPIFIGDYEFHLDYDVKIKKIKIKEGSYSYSAQYITTDENDNPIPNRLSDITNPYIKQPFVIKIGIDNYIGIQCTIRQCAIEEIRDTMMSDSIIENKSYTFDFNNQLADFRVIVTDNGKETEVIPYMYGSVVDPADTYCWYLFTAENTVRITFDSKSYIPGLNSQVYIRVVDTLGAAGNFEYLGIDQTSEGLYVDIAGSKKYGYTNITTYLVAVTDSVNGSDKKTKEELQKLIPKAAMSRGSVTTETDLNNYFNLINTDTNILTLTKKVDNQLNRVWYGYFLLKDDNNNIIPTNTINILIDIDSAIFITKCDDGRYILPAGSYIKYDPVSHIGIPVAENTIPPEYTNSYFSDGYYYYCTVYNLVLDIDPIYAAFYLTITDHDSYFIYDYVNDTCDIQFIANRYHFQRNLITEQSDYTLSFNIAQSVILGDEPLNHTDVVEYTNSEGYPVEKLVTTENLKVVLVIYKNGKPYRWKECTYDNLSSIPKDGLYYFNARIGTDDMMDTKNSIKILDCYEAGGKAELYGYVDEDCSASIYILANLDVASSIEFPRKDLDSIAPGYTDYVVTNIYQCATGLDFFHNYTGVNNTKIIPSDKSETSYYINEVPVVGRHYVKGNEEVAFLIEAIKERKDYIDYCLKLIENSMDIDFKFYNTYGDSRMFTLEDEETKIDNIDITLEFKLSLKDASDMTTKNDIIKSIKSYIEDINSAENLHIPNLITDITNEYNDRINFIEYVGFNKFGTDDQHIIKVPTDEINIPPEFINVRNILDETTDELVPDIEIRLV